MSVASESPPVASLSSSCSSYYSSSVSSPSCSTLPAQLDLTALRAVLTQCAGPSSAVPTASSLSSSCSSLVSSSVLSTPRRVLSSSPSAGSSLGRRSSRHALVKSITKRLRSMKTLLHAQPPFATHTLPPNQLQHQQQLPSHNSHSQHDHDNTTDGPGHSSAPSTSAASSQHCQQQQQQQRVDSESDSDTGSESDKENEGGESAAAPSGVRKLRESGAKRVSDDGHLDTTAEERPSTAESEAERGEATRRTRGAKRAATGTTAHWQRVVVALNEENDQLRLAVAAERERVESELDKQARRYDGIIQEKDDEISQLRALIRSMNDTMLNNTQQLIDAQAELHASHVHIQQYGDQEEEAEAEAEAHSEAEESCDVPDYPILTPGNSPLLSPNKLTLLLDDTQDILAFDSNAHSTTKPPLPPTSPTRCASAVATSSSTPARRTASGLLASPLPQSIAVAAAAAADANQLSAAWQRYLDVNHVEKERQLAQLPLTSPSTPDSKRRKVASPCAASSPQQQRSNQQLPAPLSTQSNKALPPASCTSGGVASHVRSHTLLSGAHHGAVKQLLFHNTAASDNSHSSDSNDRYESAAAGQRVQQSAAHRRAESSTAVEIRAISSPLTNRSTAIREEAISLARDELQAGLYAAAAVDAASDGSNGSPLSPAEAVAAAAARAEEDDSCTLSASDARRLSADLRRHRQLLDVKNEWSVRLKAMSGIELISRESGIGRWSEWGKELEALRPLLCDQLTDLRSSIVREACRVLVALASASRLQFEREVDVYYPLLFKGLYVTIRVIRDSCDECLQALTLRTASARCLPALLAGCSDPHAIVREKCSSYISALLVAAAAASAAVDLSQFDSHAVDIGSAISRLVQDSDHSARAAARQLFRTFSKHFPTRAAAMHAHFPTQVQKTLDTEKKLNSKPSSQLIKKKK